MRERKATTSEEPKRQDVNLMALPINHHEACCVCAARRKDGYADAASALLPFQPIDGTMVQPFLCRREGERNSFLWDIFLRRARGEFTENEDGKKSVTNVILCHSRVKKILVNGKESVKRPG